MNQARSIVATDLASAHDQATQLNRGVVRSVVPRDHDDVGALVRDSKAGSSDAFAVLVDRYRPRLLRFIRRRLRESTIDAEDVVQEAFAKAWKSIEAYDDRFQFPTWLYTIAIRTSIDHQRHRRIVVESSNVPVEVAVDSDAAATAETKELAGSLWTIADRVLRKEQFDALWLRYGEELSIKEVAKVLKRTPVGIRVMLHRARATLHPHLTDFASEGTQSDLHRERREEDA